MNDFFDKPIDRRGTNSVKWDVAEHELPLWVADMDFEVAAPIRSALEKRVQHGIFGYANIPKAWNEAYAYWWNSRHRAQMDAQNFIFCTGVVPAISSLVRKLTSPNENVLIQSPVYNIFYNSILNNGCRILDNPLAYHKTHYAIDFRDLEAKLADPQTTLMILCNPHNPVGRIWEREELAQIGALCKKHHVTVISDEIHCDLTDPGVMYTPFNAVDSTCRSISLTCLAPTKAFNIAGLQTAAVYAQDPVLYHKAYRALNTDEVAEPNVFAIDAAIAAFCECGDWLDALRQYLYCNKKWVEDYIQNELPMLFLVPSRATYLLWIDVSNVTQDSREFAQKLRQTTGLFVSNGAVYGGQGRHFIRLNIACPHARLKNALCRLRQFIHILEGER